MGAYIRFLFFTLATFQIIQTVALKNLIDSKSNLLCLFARYQNKYDAYALINTIVQMLQLKDGTDF